MSLSRHWYIVLTLVIGGLLTLAAIESTSQAAPSAGPWYVAPSGNDGNTCTTPVSPCVSINGTLNKPGFVAGDTILVATGTYTGTGDEVVLLDKDVLLSGGWDASFTVQNDITIIDGEGERPGMSVEGGVTVAVWYFTVQNGSVMGYGGGIYSSGVLTLNNCIVSNNIALKGGGICNLGTLTLHSSIVRDNTANGTSGDDYGASGIFNDHGTLTLDDSTISNNTAIGRGAIFTFYGTVTLNNSTVSGNTGGGICNQNGSVTLNNSTIRDNTGGISNWRGTLNLNNSTISGNVSYHGGGISNVEGTVTLNNSTVSDNTAYGEGGGISDSYGTVSMTNSIIAGNTSPNGPDCYGTIGSAGYNLIGNTTGCTFTPTTSDLTDVDANLGQMIGLPWVPRYHPLLAGSPAIDAGDPAGCKDHLGNPLNTDQRGAGRVGRCDIGSYEYTTPGAANSIYAYGGTPQHTPPSAAFEVPLQSMVLDSIGSPVSSTVALFSAPASEASGVFTDTGTFTTTAVTNEGGIVTASAFTANAIEGSYAVTATVSGVPTPTTFSLVNILWYVSPAGDDDNTCLSGGTACATINGALAKADFFAGDTVLVASGVYTGTGSEVVLLDKDAILSGGWDASFTAQNGTTVIDGERKRWGIFVNDATVVLEYFAVQNGLDVGISNQYGTVTLHNSAISGNRGRGISNYLGTLVLNNSSISGNVANGPGGGIYAHGTLVLNNSTVSGNTSKDAGGGIYSRDTVTLTNSTVSDNTADEGGGIYQFSGSVTLKNTIVAENIADSGPDCNGTIGSAGYNLIGDTTGCTFTPTTGDLTDVDANLGQLVGLPTTPWYHPLLMDSPAIDAGDPAGCKDHLGNPLNTDQRGAARVGHCDIGSYEYTTPGSPVYFYAYGGTPQHAPPSAAFDVPLQATVLDSIGSPVSSTLVLFSAPASGASGIFTDTGTFTTTAVTNEGGIVTASAFTANAIEGSYTVTATVTGIPTSTTFSLGNILWYVSPTGDDDNTCLSGGTACATINGVLTKTGFFAGDTVLVASGAYTDTGNEVVLVDKDAILSGGWNASFTVQNGTTIINGEEERRGISVNGATVVIELFAVQNGLSGQGGGIYNSGVLSLANSTVYSNTANSGGGIHNIGTLLLNNATVISGNAADYGSGVYNTGTTTLNNSTVTSNLANYSGGGVYNGGTVILNNSTVSNNQADIYSSGDGGGLLNAGTLVLNNSSVSGNVASGRGGGVSNGGYITITSSTIASNSAVEGGGVSNIYGADVVLKNSILASNIGINGPDCFDNLDYPGTITSEGYNLVGDTANCAFTPASGDLINLDPLIDPLTGPSGYHPLHLSSPAFNSGNPSGCTDHLDNPLNFDQRGLPRFGRCDIGAYEIQPLAFSTKAAASSLVPPGKSLKYTIVLTNGGTTDIINVYVTDTLPISLTYIYGSLSATSGSYGQASGVITWTGSVNAGEAVTITFEAVVSPAMPIGTLITNSVVISGGGETITRTTTIEVAHCVHLPMVLRKK